MVPRIDRNVGGGYSPDGLANEALHWIVEKAEKLGLEVDASYLKFFRPCFNSDLQDLMTLAYRALGEYVRPIGRQLTDGEALHKSTIDRRQLAECRYHPENLEQFLKDDSSPPLAITTRVPTGTPCPPME